jgi:RNA polymerase sigma factor (sigma-70 family)
MGNEMEITTGGLQMKQAFTANIMEIFTKERNRMTAFIRKKLNDGPHGDAEDILQDVMARIFEMADINVPLEKLTSYIYTAIRNRIIDMMRAKKPQLSLDELSEQDEFSLASVMDSGLEIEKGVENEDFYEAVYDAIDGLNEDEKAVVIATEFEEIPFKELSEQWNVPIGTLLSKKARAMEKIKKILSKEV